MGDVQQLSLCYVPTALKSLTRSVESRRMEKYLKYMIKVGRLQFAWINDNWVDIVQCAARGENDAVLLWQFLTNNQSALNSEMYGPWGNTFRQTVVSPAANNAYIAMIGVISHATSLGIIKELLALCNSSGGFEFYRTYFRPFVIANFPPNTLVENSTGMIGQVDVVNGQLIIN